MPINTSRTTRPLTPIPRSIAPDWTTTVVANVTWTLAAGYRDLLLGPEGLKLEEWLRSGQASIVKKGSHRVVYRVELPGEIVYIKHNLVPDLRGRFRQMVRPNKASMEFERALTVAKRGIGTFTPVALGEERAFAGAGESYLVTRELQNTQSLSALIAHTLPLMEPKRRARLRMSLARQLGKWVAHLHAAGLTHHDFHIANILVRLDADPICLPTHHFCCALPPSPPVLRGRGDGGEGVRIPREIFTSVRGPYPPSPLLSPLGAPGGERAARAEDGALQLFLIDLDQLRIGPPLSWNQRRDNLITLNRWFMTFGSRADCLRFWHSYFEELPDKPRGGRAHLGRDVVARTLESRLRFWRERDRRYGSNNRQFRTINGPAIKGHAVTDLDADFIKRLRDDPDWPFRAPGATVLKSSRSSTVVELPALVGGRAQTLIYKVIQAASWTDPIAALFRTTAAKRSWHYGHSLRERGLATPRPLLMLQRRRFGLTFQGYLLFEKIENTRNLFDFVKDLQSLPTEDRIAGQRRLIDQVARVFRELHHRQRTHRDAKAANILVTAEPITPALAPNAGATAAFFPSFPTPIWLIDLVGIQEHRQGKAQMVTNLARLSASFLDCTFVTRTDHLRFLRTYMQWRLIGRGDWKTWWRQVATAVAAKIERNRRSGRPLT